MSITLSDRLAAVDVGTNSFHLIVVKLLPDHSFTVLNKEKIVVRLGESPKQIKHLNEDAIRRGIEAMKLFALVAARMEAPIRAIATSAVREAHNGEEFIRRVRRETGVEIEVVSGFEEARLIYLGVMQGLPIYDERIALFDIGGGSTEILVGESGKSLYANSFKIGAIRMTQRFFPDEEISRRQVERMRLFLQGEIYFAAREVRAHAPRRMIASSGTAQTLAAMVLASRGEPIPDSLNGFTLSLAELRRVLKTILKARTHAERARLPGCDPRRADILAAGGVVLETILEECGFDECTISTYALREGIILDTIRKHAGHDGGVPARLFDLRYETVMKIGRTYDFDEAHGVQVARLALSLYDGLGTLHGLSNDSRELLEAAALLHDIGYYISHAAHHKHAYYLIRNSEMLGFNDEEIAVIANVARYHRKSHPKMRHEEFNLLSVEDRNRVRILAGLLRIADGLDRTHQGLVEHATATYDETSVAIRIASMESRKPTFELWSADRKKELLEEALGRDVTLVLQQEADLAETAHR